MNAAQDYTRHWNLFKILITEWGREREREGEKKAIRGFFICSTADVHTMFEVLQEQYSLDAQWITAKKSSQLQSKTAGDELRKKKKMMFPVIFFLSRERMFH